MRKLLYILVGAFLMYACTPVIEETGVDDKQKCEMHILTRSSATLNYPMALYAFDVSTGKMVSSTILASETDDAVLFLTKGNYQLVALTGMSVIDENPSLHDVIELAPCMNVPLQMGSATIHAMQNTTISIMLYNQVAAIDLLLKDVPADAIEVDVTLSLLNENLSYDGTLSGNSIVTIPLKKGEEDWYSERFYVLPTSNDQLSISITIVLPNETLLYGYTHRKPILANTPYSFVGRLTSGFAVNSVIDVEGWNMLEEINFSFGDSSSDDFIVDETQETHAVTEIPLPREFWNNHFVAASDYMTDTTAVLLLLSTTEWTAIPSAYNEETPEMAASLMKDYCEEELTGWDIPTRDEAKLMKAAIGGERVTSTNAVLAANALPILQVGDDADGNAIRYLCDDATYSYAWDGSTISKCGAKRTYHLRAVKRINVVKRVLPE